MEVTGKQVHEEKSHVTVEFIGEGGDVVSVQLKKDEDGNLNRLNAEEKAKAVMVQIATFDADGEDEPADISPSAGQPALESDRSTELSRSGGQQTLKCKTSRQRLCPCGALEPLRTPVLSKSISMKA